MIEPDGRWQPNDREVSSKVIDGEAIIIRLSDGIYYSMDKAGGVVWGMIEERRSGDEIAAAVAVQYDVSPDQARDDVLRLLQELVNERLIVAASDAPPPIASPPSPASGQGVYAPPRLNIYRDMGELLALDPPAPGLMDITWTDSTNKS
jgi:hypothetical protein